MTGHVPKPLANVSASLVDLSVRIGRLKLANPVLVASGTFGYAREMACMLPLHKLGGIIPKTITQLPRAGNEPWRTVETPSGLLNSIGLDNDGLASFIEQHLPYLRSIGQPPAGDAHPAAATQAGTGTTAPLGKPAIIVSIAGRTIEEYRDMAVALEAAGGTDALELNISCPNVSHGVDFGTDCARCEQVVAQVRQACSLPILAKLTPNVSDIASIAQAAEAGGADGIAAINTLSGMAVDWRKRKTLLGRGTGGLSGPAIKPVALRCVYQIAQAVKIPVVGIGGITSLDDAMEFFIAGASAIQVGTASFYRPLASMEILAALPEAIASLGADSLAHIVGTLNFPQAAPQPHASTSH